MSVEALKIMRSANNVCDIRSRHKQVIDKLLHNIDVFIILYLENMLSFTTIDPIIWYVRGIVPWKTLDGQLLNLQYENVYPEMHR